LAVSSADIHSMNKLLLAALLGFALIAVTAGEEEAKETNVESAKVDIDLSRQVRNPEPKKKNEAKKGKKGKKGRKGKKQQSLKKKKGKKGKRGKKLKKRRGKKDKAKKRNGKGKKRSGKAKKRNGKTKKRNGKTKKRSGKAKKRNGKAKKRNGKAKKKNNKGKQNKRKRNKNKKNKNKRKNRKNKKDRKKKRKNKKNKKRKSRNNKRKNGHRNGGRQTSTCASSTCLPNLAKYLNQLKEKYSNFIRQYTRIAKYQKLSTNKGNKKGVFKTTASKLIELGGNNASNIKCQGSTTSEGAKLMKTVVTKLLSCSDDIKKACTDGAPTVNQTALDGCKKIMDSFNSAVKTCMDKTSNLCDCWDGADLKAKSAEVAKCDLKNINSEVTKFKTACTKAFQECRQMEDKANQPMYICDSTQSTTNLIKKLANLNANKAALTTLIATATSKTTRVMRATTCASFTTKCTNLASKTLKAPAFSSIATSAKSINSDPPSSCTTDEKAKLKTAVTKLEEAKTGIEALIADIQTEIQAQTGSTATSAQITAAASSTATTASSSGRRVLNNMFLNLN